MRKTVLFLSVFILIVTSLDAPMAREPEKQRMHIKQSWSRHDYPGDLLEATGFMMAPASVDTYTLVNYSFGIQNWMGWTRKDGTAQPDTFFHVDDFTDLGGGNYGRLVSLEGSKSLWCGARPGNDWYMCSWSAAPGYGNSWDQSFETDPFNFRGTVTISFKGMIDSEPEYDYLTVEYSPYFLSAWIELASFDGRADTTVSITYVPYNVFTKLRFHFTSDGAWSNEDGLYNTDGAAIIDSITISDIDGQIDFEDFESSSVGDKTTAFWHADVANSMGLYSSLWNNLLDRDPCNRNFSSQIVFFNKTTFPDPTFPGQYWTPWCGGELEGEEYCQRESVISPPIDMRLYTSAGDENQDVPIPPADLPDLGGCYLNFTSYKYLPLANVVFYNWAVRDIVDGCPQGWEDRGFGYYGTDENYHFEENIISDLVGNADTIQIMLTVMDMCDVWGLVYGDCAEHTSSPYFDNISIKRFKTDGPQFSWRGLDLFQDNFPSDEDNMESWVRADMANDICWTGDPWIHPGDSIAIRCDSPLGGGIAEDGNGPRIYMHAKCTYIADDGLKPAQLAGPSLEGTYGSYLSDDGTWTIIQGDSAKTAGGTPIRGIYAFDLNDSLFTRGYMIEYYFKAFDNVGKSATLPKDAETVGDYPYYNGSYLFEFTCLPTLNTGILFVDDYDGRGTNEGIVQIYVDPSFDAVISQMPDRYDVNSPSSCVSNGPGSRARQLQLRTAYNTIFWDSGDLSGCTISDGINNKSDDCQMLVDWLQHSPHKTGLYVFGDNIASELTLSSSASAAALLAIAEVSLVNDSYFDMTGGFDGGGVPIPHVTGTGIFAGLSCYIFGGCPGINDFDVLEKTGSGQYALQLPSCNETDYYIGISNEQTNLAGFTARTVWVGHSFMYIRNGNGATLARNEFLADLLQFTESDTNEDITGSDIPVATMLAQNYPNPFNPVTTIDYALNRKGHVSLKVYDVSGRLVRTLVSEVRDAGRHKSAWDGLNDTGSTVASGVYFYRMKAKGFEKNMKMVLLR